MTPFNLEDIARETKVAQDSATTLIPFTSRYADFDMASAYDAAHALHAARLAEGANPIGRKIGFTNSEMWPLYDVHEPIWGYVYDSTVVYTSGDRVSCDISRFLEPLIEPEVVLHFHTAPPVTKSIDEILACIDWIAHGVEIVQSHFPGWKFKAPDTVVDGALHAKLLVGEPQDVKKLGSNLASTLAQLSVTLSRDGIPLETGRGSNVLGSPLAAVAHLLAIIVAQPHSAPIRAGELVTTGSLTKAYSIKAGEAWSTAFDGIALPGMTVEFA